MALILPIKSKSPKIGEGVFLAPNATLVGNVEIGNSCSVWFNAVIRGDVHEIRIGNYTNIQDGAVIHGTYKKAGTYIGNYVNIGHQAMVHGCTIHDHVLIGMGAIVMDKAIIESQVIIAAGAVVLENTHCESGYLYAGIPAKKIKALNQEQLDLLKVLPLRYELYASWIDESIIPALKEEE